MSFTEPDLRPGQDPLPGDGTVVGSHEGAHGYTIGQRRGLSLGRPAADGKPRFVLEIRPKDNTVVVGPKEALDVASLSGARYTWAGAAPADPSEPFRCEVQIRAHADPEPAVASVRDGVLVIEPDEPLSGVATGQTAVVYVGTRVLGQCTIDTTVSAVPAVPAHV